MRDSDVVAFPPHEYPIRLHHAGPGIAEAHVACLPVGPRLWTHTMAVPFGIQPLPY